MLSPCNGRARREGSLFRAGGLPCNPDAFDRRVRDDEIEFLCGYLEEYVPALSGRCLETDVCMYTNTSDEHFVIDLHPDHPQVSFASPCSGHGYKFATSHPIGMFSSSRFLQRGSKILTQGAIMVPGTLTVCSGIASTTLWFNSMTAAVRPRSSSARTQAHPGKAQGTRLHA